MTEAAGEISQRELRNDSGAVLRAVERGESFIVTRNGSPIGELTPLRRRTFVTREEVTAALQGMPSIDADRLRADADAGIDPYEAERAW